MTWLTGAVVDEFHDIPQLHHILIYSLYFDAFFAT